MARTQLFKSDSFIVDITDRGKKGTPSGVFVTRRKRKRIRGRSAREIKRRHIDYLPEQPIKRKLGILARKIGEAILKASRHVKALKKHRSN